MITPLNELALAVGEYRSRRGPALDIAPMPEMSLVEEYDSGAPPKLRRCDGVPHSPTATLPRMLDTVCI